MIGQITEDTLTNFDPANPTHLIIAYEEASQSIRTVRNKLLTSFNVTPIKDGYQAIQARLVCPTCLLGTRIVLVRLVAQ